MSKKKSDPVPDGLLETEESLKRVDFPIVGIGASAGGLAAFEAFFSGMPVDINPDMAFVLVQHLAPDHKSILTDLVKRYTKMQVFEVTDGIRVQPNCAYIIPPNHNMAFLDGELQLLELNAQRGMRLPIDFFFRSLAQDQHERAICIVLSGTGSDGTLGLRAIKGEGGMAMAQDPESTDYDGMPRSAIATDLVDYVLPPEAMAAQLIAYAARAYGKPGAQKSPPLTQTDDALKKIFLLLRDHTGHNFSLYKHNTLKRRIERRMAIQQIADIENYVKFLQQTPSEIDALFHDLLIGVTNFFRDPDAFAVLETRVIPNLFSAKPNGAAIRVWVPGCSTGEEAYSIAILLQEHMESLKKNFKLMVFATDIDNRAIVQARSGLYPANIGSDISPERLAHYFTQTADGTAYRIRKNIRDILIFSEQNVVQDAPFSKIDLISCRNLLIYLGVDLHKKLIPLFHYSLNSAGFLFLGTSESVGDHLDLFVPLDRKQKIYQQKDELHELLHRSAGSLPKSGEERIKTALLAETSPKESRPSLREMTERALLQHAPLVGVLVNERGEILYLHGRSGQYLEPAPGEAGLNIVKMARLGLHKELSAALHRAVQLNEVVTAQGLQVKTNDHFTSVNLTIRPVKAIQSKPLLDGEPTLYVVILEAAPDQAGKNLEGDQTAVNEIGQSASDIAALKQELRAKEEYLQSANEELETSNEELKSANEELQSINEEMQSTNEELETSKEELQSVNEELSTVNAELQQKIFDLSRVNNDMTNLLAGTGIGTIFVDLRLRIQRFTPAVTRIVNLIITDVGRPLSHIVSNLIGYDRLVKDTQSVLDNLTPREVEVKTLANEWFLLRIQPYRTQENMIEGAVITFSEITAVKLAQAVIKEADSLRRFGTVARDTQQAVIVHDLQGQILAWNPAAERLYGWSEAEALALNIRDLTPKQSGQSGLTVATQFNKMGGMEPSLIHRRTKDGRSLDVWVMSSNLAQENGDVYAVATTEWAAGEDEEKV